MHFLCALDLNQYTKRPSPYYIYKGRAVFTQKAICKTAEGFIQVQEKIKVKKTP